jgi:hypothetical protein
MLQNSQKFQELEALDTLQMGCKRLLKNLSELGVIAQSYL